MFKRILLAVTFVAALGAASMGTSSKAIAAGCDQGYYGYGGGYYPTYATSYYGSPYRPIVLRSAPVYPVYYGGFDGHHRHHHHRHSGIVVSFGF